MLGHIIGLFSAPKREWRSIRDAEYGAVACMFKYAAVMAAVPAVSGYIGTTQVGWNLGYAGTQYLTKESAGVIAVLTYLAMLAGVLGMGYMTRWMSGAYGESAGKGMGGTMSQTMSQTMSMSRCVVFAAYTATPLFLIGVMLLYPILWLNMLLGLPAVGYTVYLLYSGIPVMMEVNEEKGFLFSSALLGVGLVAMVAILAATVILWGLGFGPALTD